MGGTGSKASVVSQAVNDSVQSIVSKNYAGCSSQVYNDQRVVQRNVGLSLFQRQRVEQTTSVSVSCMQDARRTASLQANLANEIAQKVASESQALIGALGPSTAEAIAKMRNTIKVSVTSSNIVESHSKVIQKQFATQEFIGVSVGGSQSVSQGASVVVQAVQNIIENTDIISSLSNALEQDASAKQNSPLDFLADIFGSFAGIFIIFIIVAGIVVIYFLRSGGLATFQSSGFFSGQPGLMQRMKMPMAPTTYVQPTPSAPLQTNVQPMAYGNPFVPSPAVPRASAPPASGAVPPASGAVPPASRFNLTPSAPPASGAIPPAPPMPRFNLTPSPQKSARRTGRYEDDDNVEQPAF